MRTRRPRFPRCDEKRHPQHHSRRLRVNLVKIDEIIARKIEVPVDTQHTGPSTEVFLLLLIAKHQKRSIHGDIAANPAVRRFGGP